MTRGTTQVANPETGELELDFAPPAPALPVTGPFDASAEVLRRTLHDGRLRSALIVVASVAVAGAFAISPADFVVTCALFTISWTFSTYLAERSLRTVRVVAGRGGIAALAVLGGVAIDSGVSFWLWPPVDHRIAVISMALLVFCIVLGAEIAKGHLEVLRSRVLFVGGRTNAADLIETLVANDRIPFTTVGIVDEELGVVAPPPDGVPVLGSVRQLQRIVLETTPDLVVVATDRGRPEVFAALGGVAGLGFRVVGLPEFYEHAFGRVPVRRMTDVWFMSILHLYQRSYSDQSKRAFDVCVALLGLLLTAPLFPLIALLVLRTNGPILYRQTRLGEQGRPFTILKFRTMRTDAETTGAVWAQEGDPRMTGVGRLLRRTRLDEIPQLINVLRGDMSIVGPRPERPEFLNLLEESIPFWSRRHLLRPGITGWAQLRVGYAADAQATEEKLSYDLWYLRHRSLMVDVFICARTLSLLLGPGRETSPTSAQGGSGFASAQELASPRMVTRTRSSRSRWR
jgi:exopolysaccharide biosynthesis polyprenyl glycosylphosphotransferase